MDQHQFDRIARLFGSGTSRRAGLRAAVGAIIGLGAAKGLDPLAADAAKQPQRRHEKLPCRNQHSECIQNDQCCSNNCVPTFGGTGFRCAAPLGGGGNGKKGKNRNNGGNGYVRPQGWPCSKGQRCERGSCRALDPVSGAPVGIFCAADNGESCSSDYGCVSFYCDPETLTCAPRTPAGDSCGDGTICAADSSCTVYTVEEAPDGDYCLQPYGTHCSSDAQCASYHCAYPSRVSGEQRGRGKKDRRGARAASERVAAGELACCGMTDQVCNAHINCCDGFVCRGGTCRPNSIPTGEACTQDDVCADRDALCTTYNDNDPAGTYCLLLLNEVCEFDEDCVTHECTDGVCAVPIAESCTKADTCGDPYAHCLPYRDHDPAGTYCLLRAGDDCDESATCSTHSCTEGICTVITGDPCGAGDTCANEDASCTGYVDGSPSGNFCLLPAGSTCAADAECETQVCDNGVCLIPLQQPCNPDGDTYCQGFYAVCATYSSDPEGDYECLQVAGGDCAADADCISEICEDGTCVLPLFSPCQLGEACADGAICNPYQPTNDSSITPADVPEYFCLFRAGHTCNRDEQCIWDICAKGRCRGDVYPLGTACEYDGQCPGNAICSTYPGNTPAGTYCLAETGAACTTNSQCADGLCSEGFCCSTSGTPEVITEFGRDGSNPGEFNNITSGALVPGGLQSLYTDRDNNRVDVWTRSSTSTLTWVSATSFSSCSVGTLSSPYGLAITSDGLTALVGDTGNDRVCIFRRTAGNTDWTGVGVFGSAGTNLGEFTFIRGLALSPDGLTLAVSDGESFTGPPCSVQIFSRPSTSSDAWTAEARFGSYGNSTSQLDGPWNLTFSADGLTLYIPDEGNHRISVWSRASTSTYVFTNDYVVTSPVQYQEINQPSSVALLDGDLTMVVGNINSLTVPTFTRPNLASTTWTLQSSMELTTMRALFVDGAYTYICQPTYGVPELRAVWIVGLTCSTDSYD